MKFWKDAKPRRSKYNAQPEVTGGKRFASRKEAARYRELTMLERAGVIRDLRTQVVFRIVVNNVHICDYVADFTYRYCETGVREVEDVKGMPTPVYLLKKKLMKACYGIDIKEV